MAKGITSIVERRATKLADSVILREMERITKAIADTYARAKEDAGKARLSLVPTQIIWDVAEVREYGNRKYRDPNSWQRVELQRYIDAFYRHWLAFIEDPHSIDPESGIAHYKHCACNMAFICHKMAKGEGRKHEN